MNNTEGNLIGTWLLNLTIGTLVNIISAPFFLLGWESSGESFWPSLLALVVFPSILSFPLFMTIAFLIKKNHRKLKIAYWVYTVIISVILCANFTYHFEDFLIMVSIYTLVGNILFYRLMNIKLWQLS